MIKVCPICGKEFLTTEQRIKDGRGKYCSQKCQFESMKKEVIITCSECGKKYKVRPSKAKFKKHYCNECFLKKRKKGDKICPICGKKFHHRHNKYCSKECKLIGVKKKNKIIIKDTYAEMILYHSKYGKQICLIDIEDIEKVQKYTWQAKYTKDTQKFYVVSSQSNNKANINLHRLLVNCTDNLFVDHINHEPLDNRKQNLRICTPRSNSLNVRIRKDNKSGYIGVRQTKSGTWTVYYCHKYYGTFKTIEDAIKRRQEVEKADKEHFRSN